MTTRKPSSILSVEQVREKKRNLKEELRTIDREAKGHERALKTIAKTREKLNRQLNSLETAVGVKRV